MYSKLDQISNLGIMSTHPNFLPEKDQGKEIESENQIRPASDDPKGCPNIAPSCHLPELHGFQELHGGDDDDDDDRRKDQKKAIETGIPTRPTSRDPEGCPNIAPSCHLGFHELQGSDDEKKGVEPGISTRPSSNNVPACCDLSELRGLGEVCGKPTASEVAEDDDGFRTPDSWEHRIPVITECPPAPKKMRPPKISSAKRTQTTAGLDLSNEVESLFPRPPVQADSSDRTSKKLRTEDASQL